MILAETAYGLQVITEGRFILGLGSQVRPHIEMRFSSPWSKPVGRMREMIQAIRAIWSTWEGEGPLRFEGEHYRHTLMTPAFDPGPNPYGPPKIFSAGVMPKMTELGGEVADGFFVHPFASRRSLEEYTLPALRRGLERAGRRREDLEVVAVTIVATPAPGGDADSEGFREVRRAVKKQLAFYGSTPALRAHPRMPRLGGSPPRAQRTLEAGTLGRDGRISSTTRSSTPSPSSAPARRSRRRSSSASGGWPTG